jgi:hypothetical protein
MGIPMQRETHEECARNKSSSCFRLRLYRSTPWLDFTADCTRTHAKASPFVNVCSPSRVLIARYPGRMRPGLHNLDWLFSWGLAALRQHITG